MRLPRSVIDNYTAGVNGISEQARSALADVLAQTDLTGDVAEVRATVSAAMQRICGASADAAAELSAAVYDGIRSVELGEALGAEAESGYLPDETDEAVRAFAKKLVEGDEDEFTRLLNERIDHEVKVAANRAMVNMAAGDSIEPMYARVPSGRETCDFCLMLASRGFAYKNRAGAEHAHANCDCRIIVGWNDMTVAGYDPSELADRWEAMNEAKAAERAKRNGTSERQEYAKIMAGYQRASKRAKERAKKRKR
jgi:hypothetical protein